MRPEVQELPLPSAVMSRFPLPSRCTLLVELVIVSISPVPKFEPGPVSYVHFEPLGALPEAPEKSSLKTVDHPDGGGGTVTAWAAGVSAPNRAIAPRAAASARARQRRNIEARRGTTGWGEVRE